MNDNPSVKTSEILPFPFRWSETWPSVGPFSCQSNDRRQSKDRQTVPWRLSPSVKETSVSVALDVAAAPGGWNNTSAPRRRRRKVHLVPLCYKTSPGMWALTSVRRCCPAAAARSPRRWRPAAPPRRCPGAACWCGRRPARTWTPCYPGGACRRGTAARRRRSTSASRGWRGRRGRRRPRCTRPTGRAGRGWVLAERQRNKDVFLLFSSE